MPTRLLQHSRPRIRMLQGTHQDDVPPQNLMRALRTFQHIGSIRLVDFETDEAREEQWAKKGLGTLDHSLNREPTFRQSSDIMHQPQARLTWIGSPPKFWICHRSTNVDGRIVSSQSTIITLRFSDCILLIDSFVNGRIKRRRDPPDSFTTSVLIDESPTQVDRDVRKIVFDCSFRLSNMWSQETSSDLWKFGANDFRWQIYCINIYSET